MRKIVLALTAICLVVNVFADEKSQSILSALQQKVATLGDYRVEFSVTIDGQTLKGSYEVSGESYRVVTPDIEVYCDGRTKYEVNLLDREVSIDTVDPADRTVLGNPTHLFDFLDGSYTHHYVGPALIGGVTCERIELTEAGAGNGSGAKGTAEIGQQAEVYIATATGLPVRLTYRMGMLNTDATIDVARITPHITLDRAAFGFDAARYKGFEVIDFR